MAIKYSKVEQSTVEVIREQMSDKDYTNPESMAGFTRKTYAGKASADLAVKDGAREFIAKITTGVRDRDNEIVNPDGIDFSQFRKNPVILWAHNYIEPPIGKAVWIKPWKEGRDKKGYLSMGRVAQGSTKAQEIFNLMQEGVINTVSIGFISIAGHSPTDEDVKKDKSLKGVRYIHDKVMMLEYSLVNVPANPEATIDAVSKGDLTMSVEMQKDLKIHTPITTVITDKKALPHIETPIDGIESGWSLTEERSGANTENLMSMSAWADTDNLTDINSYKFIHHRSSVSNPLVWLGLVESMSKLQTGAVSIPEQDRHGVYKHLAKHYEEFGKVPPDFILKPKAIKQSAVKQAPTVTTREIVTANPTIKRPTINTNDVIPVKRVIDTEKLAADAAEDFETTYLGRV
ncbi:MAG: hypothetical protein GY841_04415 [FCB group bacterium]|nr:hypothetical protein [FCB group bacterium]